MKLALTNITKYIIVFLFITLSIQSTYAWKEGHGGYAIQYNGNTYLLDLRENGNFKNPYFDHNIKINSFIKSQVSYVFSGQYFLSTKFNELLSLKLSEIEKHSSDLAFVLLAGIYKYSWSFVQGPLEPTPDLKTFLKIPNAKFVPLANRNQQSIRIDRNIFKALPVEHQVALIFHEVIYSYIIPKFDHLSDISIASFKARELTGYLFRPEFAKRGVKGFNTINRNSMDYVFKSEQIVLEDNIIEELGSIILTSGSNILSTNFTVVSDDGDKKYFELPAIFEDEFNEKYLGLLCQRFFAQIDSDDNKALLDLNVYSYQDTEIRFADSFIQSGLEVRNIIRNLTTMRFEYPKQINDIQSCTKVLTGKIEEYGYYLEISGINSDLLP